ncbi:MAG: nitrogen fixation protein FixA, partial [Mesorhizobium sp.]
TAADAGIDDLTRCGLRGSPTVVKRVFAPTARAESATQIDTAEKGLQDIADELIADILTRRPALEHELAFNSGT